MFTKKNEEISEVGSVLDITRLRRGRIRIGALLLSLIGVLAFDVPHAGAQVPIPNGTVMVSVGNGQVQEWNPSPTPALITTISTGFTGFTTGSAFDSSGNFYVTDFSSSAVTKFDPTGANPVAFGSGYNEPESILFSSAGNAYVGQANDPHTSLAPILELNSTGGSVGSFPAATENRGTDWIDLASDHCTVFYTSEGTHVKRYNTCTNTQLTDFNSTALPGDAFALRILPSGGVLIADSAQVVQLDSTGLLVKTYTFDCACSNLFALNLDPDGTSFWTADIASGNVLRVDIASGNIVEQFNVAGTGISVAGLSVKGEITVGGGGITVSHDTPSGVTTVFNFPGFNFNFKSTPNTAHTNHLDVTAIFVDPSAFNAGGEGAPFPTAQCFVYGGTSGKCVEFDVKCTGPDCGGTYNSDFATSFDFTGSFVGKPGFLKVEKPCSPTVFGDPSTTNQITAFIVQRQDPTTHARSGGTGSCWAVVQGLTSTTYPSTDLSILKLAPRSVEKGSNLSYGIVVFNLGPNLATGVSVTDRIPLPSTMSLVSSAVCISGTSGASCTTNKSVIPPCTVTSNVVTCQVGNLLPFSFRTLAAAGIQLTFKVNSNVGTTITNTATVTAFNDDPRLRNNSSTAVTTVKSSDH
jgi:uncharacterized repeat protein (TIGR01451 family)